METATKQEILDKTNAILQEYKNLVMRLWDLYEEMDQEDTDLVNAVALGFANVNILSPYDFYVFS